MDSTIHWINFYPVDSAIDFPHTYPLDSDLSSGYSAIQLLNNRDQISTWEVFLFKIYLYENLAGVDPRLLNAIILNYRRAFTYMACTWMVLDGNVEAVN